MRSPEREPRDWLTAVVISALLHACLLWLGQSGLDARPQAADSGLGPVGEFEVIALSALEAEALVARRGAARVPLLAEAGRSALASAERRSLEPALPPGPEGSERGPGPTPALSDARGDRVRPGEVRPLPAGALPLPEALPAPPSQAAGRPVAEDPGPDGAGELVGSQGLEDQDASAADGDAAPGLDANLSDAFVLRQVAPDYPPALAKRDRAAGILQRSGRLGLAVDERGRAVEVRVLESTGAPALDQAAVRALRRWAFDVDLLRARGLLGVPLWVEIDASPARR